MVKSIDLLDHVEQEPSGVEDDAYVLVNLSKLIARLVQLELQVREFEQKEREAVFANQLVWGSSA